MLIAIQIWVMLICVGGQHLHRLNSRLYNELPSEWRAAVYFVLRVDDGISSILHSLM